MLYINIAYYGNASNNLDNAKDIDNKNPRIYQCLCFMCAKENNTSWTIIDQNKVCNIVDKDILNHAHSQIEHLLKLIRNNIQYLHD